MARHTHSPRSLRNEQFFLSDVEVFYDLAVKDLALPTGVGEKIKVANATYTTRFGVRLRDRMFTFTGWRSAHSNHQSPAKDGIRYAPTCARSHHPDGPKANHALTFNLDHSSGAPQDPLVRSGIENLIADTLAEKGLQFSNENEISLREVELNYDDKSITMTGTYAAEAVASEDLTVLAIESEGYKYFCASRQRPALDAGYTISADFSYIDGAEIGTVVWSGTSLCSDS